MAQPDTNAIVFLDFDGTVSCADVVDAILERFAAPEWLRVEEDWRAGRIGSRECLRRQMALVRGAPSAIDALVDAIGIDDGFARLLQVCGGAGLPVHIVSDGFDYCINRLLRLMPDAAQAAVQAITVRASHLEPAMEGEWRTRFPFPENPCSHGCATCKPSVMRELTPAGATTIFVGDGLSDRYAAAAADVVFAKDRLASHCRAEDIVHVPFRSLADVALALSDGLHSGHLIRPRPEARADA